MMLVTTELQISLDDGASLYIAASRAALTSLFPQCSLTCSAYFSAPRLLLV